ncbi:MAG: glycosyltransferase [Mesorhizobium sp.]|nr:glycosyltransferase [Mesorhizobium sp.]
MNLVSDVGMQRNTSSLGTMACFSHLRWNFVFQRPQHLLTRAALDHDVLYFEEPVFEDVAQPTVRVERPQASLRILTPVLPEGASVAEALTFQRELVDRFLAPIPSEQLTCWYYTPMALRFTRHLVADVCVYDCMDELSAFKNAPAELRQLEKELFGRANLVFTGGQSLYEAKRAFHAAIYPFPSSIDAAHFRKARTPLTEPEDQRAIPRPRVGFFGVIDERMDLALVAATAAAMPDVHFVMLGPVVKIDPSSLPAASNLHWLGRKSYVELPAYLAHWQAGWMPFALNESTRYISPTKTPEFLAAGLPVVSTAIVDVVRTYGAEGLVEIVDEEDAASTLRDVLGRPRDHGRGEIDAYLAAMSWDQTWKAMQNLISSAAAPASVPLQRGAHV